MRELTKKFFPLAMAFLTSLALPSSVFADLLPYDQPVQPASSVFPTLLVVFSCVACGLLVVVLAGIAVWLLVKKSKSGEGEKKTEKKASVSSSK